MGFWGTLIISACAPWILKLMFGYSLNSRILTLCFCNEEFRQRHLKPILGQVKWCNICIRSWKPGLGRPKVPNVGYPTHPACNFTELNLYSVHSYRIHVYLSSLWYGVTDKNDVLYLTLGGIRYLKCLGHFECTTGCFVVGDIPRFS